MEKMNPLMQTIKGKIIALDIKINDLYESKKISNEVYCDLSNICLKMIFLINKECEKQKYIKEEVGRCLKN